jgi:nucleoside-diphosphate-sugar epimerase
VRALVIGGTGPTGPAVVRGLVARGYAVTILHTGRHESDEVPPQVEHLHTDPFSGEATSSVLGGATFDLALVMYGRLRVLAELLAGRVGRLVTIGGIAARLGFVDPRDLYPWGMPVPTPPHAPNAGPDEPMVKARRIVETEATVFELHPTATHLRYPLLYGPRQLVPREWPLVRRALDGRPVLVLPDGGLTLETACYGENAAHAVLCAVDQPEAAAGRIYDVGDAVALTLRQVADIVAGTLGHEWEIVNLPYDVAAPARPLVKHWWTGHRVVDTTPIRAELGYEDLVPAVEAVERTVRWLAENRPPPGGTVERRLQDPFDYAAEDRLVACWREARVALASVAFDVEPGYGGAYYGREPNPGGDQRVGA